MEIQTLTGHEPKRCPDIKFTVEEVKIIAGAQLCPCVFAGENNNLSGLGDGSATCWRLAVAYGLLILFTSMYSVPAAHRDSVTVIVIIVGSAQLSLWWIITTALRSNRAALGHHIGNDGSDSWAIYLLQCCFCHGFTLAQERQAIVVGKPVVVEVEYTPLNPPKSPEGPRSDVEAQTGRQMAQAAAGGCKERTCGYAAIAWVIFTVFFCAFYVVFMNTTTSQCFTRDYDASLVLPANAQRAGVGLPIEVGTAQNFKTEVPIDLTGVWWLRFHGYEGRIIAGLFPEWLVRFFYYFYSTLHAEELASFKGTSVNTTNSTFPMRVSAPTGRMHQWGFSTSVAGRFGIYFAAQKNPLGNLNIDFFNSSAGKIRINLAAEAWMVKRDKDVWYRSAAGDINSVAAFPTYRLTRIIREDGSPTQYWPAFVQHMGAVKIRTFTSNNRCERQQDTSGSLFDAKAFVQWLWTISTSSCADITKQCEAAETGE
eukprot:TRINITY_DN100894_c0_g1_i1.p1 TRINITY_DN100894_c0_g1~~TRINITY_DN100894_c0_g1_i1.p1  ORF type:complete len:493 (-),score=37.44 TRINITY_DN100894_c0_g1_i1:109-1554(-)